MLGADPELLLVGAHGAVVSSSEQVADANLKAQFGKDGGGTLAELRPRPCEQPLDLVRNLRTAMCAAPAKVRRLRWVAGSHALGMPIGGHIHFGHPKLRLQRGALHSYQARINAAVRCLDVYLAPAVLLVEDRRQAAWRRHPNNNSHPYGGLGDMREQPHGFEYRVPGSWLTSPHVALAVLSLAKVLVHESLSRRMGSDFNVLRDIDSLRHDFAIANLAPFRSRQERRWAEIERCELFPALKDECLLLRRLADAGRTWFPPHEVKVAWGVDGATSWSDPLTLKRIWRGVR